MGETSSTLKPVSPDDIRNNTEFTGEEIQAWYKGFLKRYPDGTVTVDEFKKIYASIFQHGDASKFAEYAFRTFDSDSNGKLDFPEFICAMSVITRGTVEQKLSWAFRVYDVDGSGYITRKEMLDVMKAIYKAVGTVKMPEGESSPENVVDRLFRGKDKNRDGQFSQTEFVEGVKSYPALIRFLEM